MALIGLHARLQAKGIQDACNVYHEKFGINVFQVFIFNPQGSTPVVIAPTDKPNPQYTIIVHASHLTNGIWNNPQYGFRVLYEQASLARDVGACGVIVHLPNDFEKLKLFKSLDKKFDVTIIFENTAMQSSWNTPQKFNAIATVLPKSFDYGLCIDTAHLWASDGYACLQSYKAMWAWFNALDIAIISRIRAFHLNGSIADPGSGRDLHAIPTSRGDRIWGRQKNLGDSSLAAILEFALKHNVICILEIDALNKEKTTKKALKTLHKIGGPEV
jgi:endonuclease IV